MKHCQCINNTTRNTTNELSTCTNLSVPISYLPCRGFSSVLPIILNPTSGFNDDVSVSSVRQFFHSNAWLGAVSALVGVIGGQLAGLIADRYVHVLVLWSGAKAAAFIPIEKHVQYKP